MKSIPKFKTILILSLVLITSWSCNNDGDPAPVQQPQTITDLAVATPELSSLVAALTKANLADVLAEPGSYTVFAPTNEAFSAFLSANGFASLDEVPVDVLTQVLLNHVVSDEFPSTSLSTGYVSTLATQSGTNLNLSMFIDTTSGVSLNGVSNVTTPDIKATNGIIHIVDAVIGLPTVVDHAAANPNFSNLVAALGAADGNLVSVLSGDGPFTVLAPDDDAFAVFLNGAALGDVPTDALANVLLNHVLSGVVTSTDLANAESGYTNTLATGPNMKNLSLYFNTTSGVMFNGTSSVTAADIVASNGIIHAIDTVIDIPTVVTFAVADPNFSTLVTALTTLTPATDFVSILSRTATGNGDSIDPPFTVFAPTNDAFAALPAVPDEPVLTQVLLHHVVGGANVTSGDLTPNGDTVASTLQGQNLTITLPGTNGNIANVTDGAGNSDIGIVAVDVQAGNGVIHVINKVALPSL